jgi:hypothetical protein
MDTEVGLSSPFTCARVTHQAPALCSHTILAGSSVGRGFPSSVGGFHVVLSREDRGVVCIIQAHRSKLRGPGFACTNPAAAAAAAVR